MKCSGYPCPHTCEHLHCDRCGTMMHVGPIHEKMAEFIRNFGRLPTAWEQEHGVCDDCYSVILAIDKRAALN